MKKTAYVKFSAIGFTICFIFYGCGGLSKSYPAVSIDRNIAFSPAKAADPLRLVVEIKENGELLLNRIETGTINDPNVLSAKIKVVFDDREKNEISEKEILIERTGVVRNEDLDKLIEILTNLRASPIRIIQEK